jgi:hypothetical protein
MKLTIAPTRPQELWCITLNYPNPHQLTSLRPFVAPSCELGPLVESVQREESSKLWTGTELLKPVKLQAWQKLHCLCFLISQCRHLPKN